MEEIEKNQDSFLQGAQQELRKEMATLQKKILMDTVSEEVQLELLFKICVKYVKYELISLWCILQTFDLI